MYSRIVLTIREYDHSLVKEEGARLENLVANALLKECHYLEDTKGIKMKLHYVRTKEGKEIDFLVTQDKIPSHVIEVKSADGSPAPGLLYFEKYFKETRKLQLVKDLKREVTLPKGLEIRQLIPWLSNLSLN